MSPLNDARAHGLPDLQPDPAQAPIAAAMLDLMARHRSIRRFSAAPVDLAALDQLCARAIAGASSSGNLNLVAIIRSTEPEAKRRLWALHQEQDMVLEAPVVLTFCADSHRTRTWLAQRGARLNFGNFHNWHVAAFDAIIVAQTLALALESQGLGICYLGTTLSATQGIGELLGLPDHCVPATTLVVGHPAEQPAARDRLPLPAYVHHERYQAHDAAAIDALYAQREQAGWARYRALGPEFAARMDALGITSLAQFYTSPLKYDPDVHARESEDLRRELERKGFMP